MGRKLEWLEFGRGIAALAVVISHIHYYLVPLPDSFESFYSWGWWAVSFFFVISGFIIFHVHSADLDRPDRAANFLWRRFIRIFPTYWLVLLFAIGCRQFLGNADYTISITTQFWTNNLFLLSPNHLLIGPAWSLRNEIAFYAVFLVAIFNKWAGVTTGLAWAIIIIFWTDPNDHLISAICNPRDFFFIIGIIIAAVFPLVRGFASISAPRFSSFLGQISYPLYVSHLPMFLVVRGIFKRLGVVRWEIVAPVGVIFCIFAAWVIFRFFEKPLREFLSSIDQKRQQPLVGA